MNFYLLFSLSLMPILLIYRRMESGQMIISYVSLSLIGLMKILFGH